MVRSTRVTIELTPEHYADDGISTSPRRQRGPADACWASTSLRVPAPTATASASRSDAAIARWPTRWRRACERVFGHDAARSTSPPSRAAELKLVNRVAAAAWQAIFGFHGAESHTKRIPDLVFNVPSALRLAFLRGFLRGDGTVAAGRIAFATSSYDLASGLMYLLSSLGVVASLTRARAGRRRCARSGAAPASRGTAHWQITVSAAEDLRLLEAAWADHPAAAGIREHVDARRRDRLIVASRTSTAT